MSSRQGTSSRPGAHPQEGKWVKAMKSRISAACRTASAARRGEMQAHPQRQDGIIEEALVETLGCSGMTHSAAMAAEIYRKTHPEALNTDLVRRHKRRHAGDFRSWHGRSQTAFSEGGLPVARSRIRQGAAFAIGTMFRTRARRPLP